MLTVSARRWVSDVSCVLMYFKFQQRKGLVTANILLPNERELVLDAVVEKIQQLHFGGGGELEEFTQGIQCILSGQVFIET